MSQPWVDLLQVTRVTNAMIRGTVKEMPVRGLTNIGVVSALPQSVGHKASISTIARRGESSL